MVILTSQIDIGIHFTGPYINLIKIRLYGLDESKSFFDCSTGLARESDNKVRNSENILLFYYLVRF